MTQAAEKNLKNLRGEISRSAENGNLSHGILIECENEEAGADFARFIALCLVCRGEHKPCGVCHDCRKAENNGHPDIFETDGIKGKSKNFTVDAVREIRTNAFIVPNESDRKIYILKNGNNMNEQAQNALLKILEEPPSYVFFIIVTSSKSAMLETVLSRVSVYSLLSGENEAGEKEREIIKGFVPTLLSVDELKLLEQTAVFLKNSRLAKEVLELLSEIFRDALVKKSGFVRDFRFPDETETVSNALTAKAILRLTEVCGELSESVDRNCNNNLLVTRMCYEFKRAVGK